MPESKFSKPTDSAEEIKLESALIYADWRQGSAYAGCGAGFEVVTVFVGNGATIEVSGKSEKGKKLGKIKGEMEANRYVGSFDIPGDMEPGDQISFEAKLSANNIDGESSTIPVYPAPVVTNMKWSAQEAMRGDRLTLSGDVDKVPAGTEAEIIVYEYDQDGAHDKVAAIPVTIKDMKFEAQWEYEYHEDTNDIPTKEEMEKHGGKYRPPEYFFVLVINESRFGADQESGLLQFKDWIELKLINHTGKEKYVLYLPDGSTEKGAFDDNGMTRLEKTLPGKYRVEVETEDDRSLTYDVSSGKSHALDCRRRLYFLDVGKWGRSSNGKVHTEFGVVSENLILLCEWKRTQMPNRGEPKHLPEKVKRILKGGTDKDGRGFIRDWLEDPQPFTEPGEAFVFLPDLHLHLYKCSEFDSFTEPNSEKQSGSGSSGAKQEWVSLEGELASLLELCKKNAKKIVQVGDCFDIWKSQHMLIDDLLNLELYIKNPPALSEPKRVLKYPVEFMACLNMDPSSDLDEKDIDGIKQKILDQKMVMEATVRTYDKIFPGGKIPEEFYWLHGNHDNMLENPYYSEKQYRMDERLDRYGIDRKSYMIPDCRRRPVWWNGGKKKYIWAEHGHYSDWFNNDENFYKGALSTGYLSGYSLMINFADTLVEKYLYDKMPRGHGAQIERIKELKKDEPNVRVVVMGHTHSCLLEDVTDRLSEDAENTEAKLAGGSPGFR